MTVTPSVGPQTQTLDTVVVENVETKPEAPAIVKTMAVVTPLLSFLVQNWMAILAIVMGKGVHTLQIATMAGGLVGVFLMPLLIMGLFQIGKRFRNPRSRWTVFLNTGIVFLVISILSAIVKVVA